MYRIRFAPHLCNKDVEPEELNCMRVYSDDINKIHQFLHQHNFDIRHSQIENISYEKAKADEKALLDRYELITRKFRSVTDNEVYEIMTTENLLDLAVDYVTNEIGTFMLFGPCIIRRDIQAMQLTAEILASMPYTEILDYRLLDSDSVGDPYDTSWMVVSKTMEQFMESCDDQFGMVDLGEVYGLIDEACKRDIMPITLEAYVKTFVFNVLKGG